MTSMIDEFAKHQEEIERLRARQEEILAPTLEAIRQIVEDQSFIEAVDRLVVLSSRIPQTGHRCSSLSVLLPGIQQQLNTVRGRLSQ